jgi:hypothetical protein
MLTRRRRCLPDDKRSKEESESGRNSSSCYGFNLLIWDISKNITTHDVVNSEEYRPYLMRGA